MGNGTTGGTAFTHRVRPVSPGGCRADSRPLLRQASLEPRVNGGDHEERQQR